MKVNILNYIDKMQQMYGDKEPSSMVPEPRSNYADGLKVDPVADSGRKLNEVIAAYERYRGGRKNPVINFNKFFEIYARENFADGQLVQPSGDGSRPGYNGKKKLDPANLKRQQDSLQNYYDKFGKETLDKLSKKRHGKVFNKLSTDDLSNFKRRITKFEDFITENNRMPTEKEARSIGRQPRIKTEQAIQIKLLEETNTGKFFDPEKFAKENNISMKELKREAGLLQNNIYNKRMKMSGKEMRRVLDWIPDDASISDNALNKLWKSKLIKYERNKIEELFYDAFGREFVKGTKDKNPNFNPKKHLAIRNNLTEYYKLREAINLKYPNINLALDHPLSKSTLKKVFNATPDQLTRVNPLEADLNNGFKDSLSLQYEKAIQGKNITQKKAVEKIARDLKLNIGKVSDDATNFKYGVKEFQKLNIKDEILKAVQTQADLSSNFKNYVKQNPDLFKTANVNPNTNITKITQTQVKGIAKILEAAGFKCQLANGLTCNDPRAYTQSIKENMAKVKQGDNAAVAKINKLGKSMKAFKGVAKATGWGLLAELGFAAPLAAVDYAKGANRDEIISNATYGLFGKSEEEQLKERYADYGKAQKLKDTYNNLLEAENLAKTGAGYRTQAVNKLRAEDLNKKLFEQSKPFNTILPPSMGFKGELDYDKFLNAELRDQQRRDEFAKEKEQRSKEIGILQPSTGLEAIQLAGGGIAGLSGGDKSGPPPESGPASQGLRSLIKNGNKL